MEILYNTQVPANWKLFGVMLKIQLSFLNNIATKYPQSPGNCLLEVLERWLNKVNPPPSWKALIEALQILGEEKLALELETKHQVQ